MTDPAAHLLNAQNALAARRPADALAALEQAAAAPRGSARHWAGVAQLAHRLGDDDLALAAARRLLAGAPADRVRRTLVMELTAETGRAEDAVTMARALERDAGPDPIPALSLGINLARLGRGEEAIAALRRALSIAPDLAVAWEQIALIKRFTPGDADIGAMEAAAQRAKTPLDRAIFAYALGKARDDIGDVDSAFAAFSLGAGLIAGPGSPNLTGLRTQAHEVPAAFPQPEHGSDATSAPILIIGNARSGTTLVERILAVDPTLTAGGELKALRLACQRFPAPSPPAVESATAKSGGRRALWNAVGRAYLSRVAARFGDARVVDKSLINFLYAGAFLAAFPKGRVIWVRRDPLDVAWSCFRTRFRDGLLWSYRFDALAAFMRVYRDIASHWAALYPDRVYALDYEALIAKPDLEATRLFAFIGRPIPDWRSFTEHKGAVLTASFMQVRQPLNDRSIGAAHRYGAHLDPLRVALAHEGLLDG